MLNEQQAIIKPLLFFKINPSLSDFVPSGFIAGYNFRHLCPGYANSDERDEDENNWFHIVCFFYGYPQGSKKMCHVPSD